MLPDSELIDQIPALVAYIDASGMYRRMNRAWEQWAGVERGQLLGRHAFDVLAELFGKAYAREALPHLQHALQGEAASFEGACFANGQMRRAAIRYTPDRDEQGVVRGVMVLAMEVGEPQHTDERARIQEERLQMAAEFSNMGIWDRNLATNELTWNEASFRVMGFEDQDQAPSVDELYSRIHPEDRVRHKDIIETARRQRTAFQSEFRLRKNDGQWIWIHSRGRFVLDANGEPVHALGVHFDITEQKLAAERAIKQARLIDSILESTTDGVFMLDMNWRFTYLNSRAKAAIGMGELAGKNVWDVFPHAQATRFGECYSRTMLERVPTDFEEFYPEPLNRWYEVHAYPTETGLVAFFRDVSERKRAGEVLRLHQQTISAVPVGICIAEFDSEADFPLVYVNPAFEELTGYSRDEVLGRNCRFLQGPGTREEDRSQIRAAIHAGKPVKAILRNYRKDGTDFLNELQISPVQNKEGRVTHLVGIQNDVTELIAARDRLTYQAQFDALTGLPNRYFFFESLRQALRQASRHAGTELAVIYLDVDNLKYVNERLGHIGGDKFLKKIGARIRAEIRESDIAARLSGDEFAVLATEFATTQDIERLIERILAAIAAPVQVGRREVVVTASAGYACAPRDATDAEELLRKADLAMFTAKRECKNSWKSYRASMDVSNEKFIDVASGLREALKRNEFVLHYQARVNAGTGSVEAMEALIRWKHPARGLISPGSFIPVAEETGLILPIGQWVIEEALGQIQRWRQAGLRVVPVAVNVSAAQFRSPGFVQTVAGALQAASVPGGLLEMEVTESVLMDEQVSSDTLAALRRMGIRIAIDDFGTAYSGLSYLQRFSVDVLKIDRGFTMSIHEAQTAATICQSILQLAQRLDLTTVAEGVELPEQARLLQEWGCDQLQGFYFGYPMPADSIESTLAAAKTSE